jgi:Cu(I)/Ag(I) efflux system membrane fusion protein
MKKTNLILWAGVILVIGLSLLGCRNHSAQETMAEAAAESTPSSIRLTPEAVKTAGIQTAEAGIRPVIRTIQATGEITFNPKRLAHVTARTAGRIEQLLVYPGERVQKGQLLLSLYSQDFLILQAELFQASERFKRLQNEQAEKSTAKGLLDSARSRLRLFDVTDAELNEIENSGSIKTLLPVRAPLDGNISESAVTAGDYVELGASFFKIADLLRVWVHVHIFEKDLSLIRLGSEVVLRAGAFPGREFRGRLFQIGTVVDEKSRTIEGRIELANPNGDLRPGMFVEAELISSAEAKSLFVPGAAIQDFQNKKVVFVRTGENTFAVRFVETGMTLNGFVEILKGLEKKEVVATNGSFFLKSELLKKSLGEE